MAKTKGPLLSMSARGQIGQSQVYAKWKGVPYVRQHVIPANPNSTAQQSVRSVFKYLQDLFRSFGAVALQPWTVYVQGRPMIARNGFTKSNLALLKDETDNSTLIGSPGAKGGPAFSDFVAATGGASGEIDVTLTEGTVPAGWSIVSASFMLISEADPHDLFDGFIAEQSVAAPGPYEFTFEDLTPGVTYECLGWLVYQRADGGIAVSPSGIASAVAHA